MQQQDQPAIIRVIEKAENLSESSITGDAKQQTTTDDVSETESSATDSAPTSAEGPPDGDEGTLNQPQQRRFAWSALIAALAVAAFFAATARFNSQPSPSYIPAAIFSASGCGLLVTAIRKLHALPGAGLLEAGLSGFGLALLQFAVTFTYPGVYSTITAAPEYSRAFFITWGLIAFFAVILSMAGATIGHLAFAPARPLPARSPRRATTAEEEEEDAMLPEDENDTLANTDLALSSRAAEHVHTQSTSATANAQDAENPAPLALLADEENEQASLSMPDGQVEDEQEAELDDELGTEETKDTNEATELDDELETEQEADEADEDEVERTGELVTQGGHTLLNYAITVLLLGLLPMIAGYVFAATYDFIMNAININTIAPAFYPTLSLLSGLLPWRLVALINLNNSNGGFIVFALLWRIPDSILGNPNLFDVQALESAVFSATGLALLLITMYRSDNFGEQRQSAPLGILILLESLLGLILVLPANLWLLRGLEGILQLQTLLVQLPTIHLLNPALFILNLLTGTLACLLIGLIVKRQYQLWTSPRSKTIATAEEEQAEEEEE